MTQSELPNKEPKFGTNKKRLILEVTESGDMYYIDKKTKVAVLFKKGNKSEVFSKLMQHILMASGYTIEEKDMESDEISFAA
jgi:hypothetical protein